MLLRPHPSALLRTPLDCHSLLISLLPHATHFPPRDLLNLRSEAKITLTLSNEGTDAFEPNEWGTEIVIEKHLRRDGSSSVRLWGNGADGKITTKICTTMAEVHVIVDHFKIQGVSIIFFLFLFLFLTI